MNRFAKDTGRKVFLTGGRQTGRRAWVEWCLIVDAATPEQARLAIEDLHTKGVALLDGDGMRVEPQRRGVRPVIKFDEGSRERD